MGEGCPSEGQERVKLCLRVAVIGSAGLGMLTEGASVEAKHNFCLQVHSKCHVIPLVLPSLLYIYISLLLLAFLMYQAESGRMEYWELVWQDRPFSLPSCEGEGSSKGPGIE